MVLVVKKLSLSCEFGVYVDGPFISFMSMETTFTTLEPQWIEIESTLEQQNKMILAKDVIETHYFLSKYTISTIIAIVTKIKL